MKFYLDTEFIESGPHRPIELISIAIVSEDGREFYAENRECPRNTASDWVQKNVFPHLTGPCLTLAAIAEAVKVFVGTDEPEFWGY